MTECSVFIKVWNAWATTKQSSRKCYLAQLPPGSVTTSPTDGIPNHLRGIDPSIEESEIGFKNFAIIENHIENIDWLFLSSNGHKRLFIEIKEKQKKFKWLIP